MTARFELELLDLGFGVDTDSPARRLDHHKYPVSVIDRNSRGDVCLIQDGINVSNYPTIVDVKRVLQEYANAELKVGDEVEKVGGDYRFRGPIIGIAKKKSGKILYLVEDDRGICHIFSKANIQRVQHETVEVAYW